MSIPSRFPLFFLAALRLGARIVFGLGLVACGQTLGGGGWRAWIKMRPVGSHHEEHEGPINGAASPLGVGIGIGIDSCPRLLEGRQVHAKSLVAEAHGVALDSDTDADPDGSGRTTGSPNVYDPSSPGPRTR